MTVHYSFFDWAFYLFLYAFLGWAMEVLAIAVKDRHFTNRGFLNLPLELPYGFTAVILLMILPTQNHNYVGQYVLTLITFSMIWSLSFHFVKRVSGQDNGRIMGSDPIFSKKGFLFAAVVSGFCYVIYLVVHPVVFGFLELLPDLFVKIFVIAAGIWLGIDFFSIMYTLKINKRNVTAHMEQRSAWTQELGERITAAIWRRLKKAYPGIEESEESSGQYVFAKGICFDKLVWVFLVSAFFGALIEMVFCRAGGDIWMNRSSLLYGTFSVVWGFGAVVLTIVLQRLAGKEDRVVFLAGAVIGGAYEYICSVLTEIVFGTVFWDYSDMPLNIGGRTNLVYCVFWGLLSVVWVKMVYPPMSREIEKLPPLLGKVLTWLIIVVMVCDGVLTMAAMTRYTARQTEPEAENVIEELLDSYYDDAWMEHRWPNMVVTD